MPIRSQFHSQDAKPSAVRDVTAVYKARVDAYERASLTQKICLLIDEGKSPIQIAKKVGAPLNTVNGIIAGKKNGTIATTVILPPLGASNDDQQFVDVEQEVLDNEFDAEIEHDLRAEHWANEERYNHVTLVAQIAGAQ